MEENLQNLALLYIVDGYRVLLWHSDVENTENSEKLENPENRESKKYLENPEKPEKQEIYHNPKASMLKRLYEKTGLKESDLENLQLRYITLGQQNGQVKQNYYYFASLKDPHIGPIRYPGGEIRWFEGMKALDLEMSLLDQNVLEHYLFIGKHTKSLYGGIASGDHVTFADMYDY